MNKEQLEKFFNTAGPIKPELHYYIPSSKRMDWEETWHLIDSQKYFLLHAPRQTGKTTALLEMMHALNKEARYTTLYINIEGAQAARNDVEAGISTVCSVLAGAADIYLNDNRLWDWLQEKGGIFPAQDRFAGLLTHWARINEKPIVLLIDEADALIGDTLVSMLRQIRSGYAQRPDFFPQSIVLCGVRDIKDYRIHLSSGDIITGGSAFNIKAESLNIDNFTKDEIRHLLLQHTSATGQEFAQDIFSDLWEDAKGQPWLVNALAYEMTWKDQKARDRKLKIEPAQYKAARERLILSRSTHLDQLTDKLQEPRVHNVISALLSSEQTELQIPRDDMEYVADLGLIRHKPYLQIANRIYQEIIPRELISVTQATMVQDLSWYQSADYRIDMTKLLTAFQQFFRENSEIWVERFQYKEAGPQLLLQAFLQRILNGGGRLNREYGLGRKRTDLLIEWPLDKENEFHGPEQRIVIELKILRGALETLLATALAQTYEYADKCSADEAHIIIFNRDPNIPWEQKIWRSQESYKNTKFLIWGC
ncbi:AAA-like domain-containing protein [Desulfobacter sp.]